MQLCAALVLLGLLSGVASQSETTLTGVNMFDCKRAGITCGTDEICDASDSSNCACRTGTTVPVENVNCVLDADAAGTCSDTSKCGDFGTCYPKGGTDTCYCKQSHYGDSCEKRRVELTCNSDDLVIDVTPFGTFAGIVYAKDKINDVNCQLTGASGTFSNTFDLDNGAGCGVVKEDMLDPDDNSVIGNKYTMTVVVQYNQDYVMGTDQELTLTCNYPDTATVTAVVFETDADSNLDDAGTGTAEGSPLIFGIQSNNAAVAEDATVEVGDELNVKITLSANEVYTKFLIEECTVTNGLAATATNYASLNFVDNDGCPSDNQVVRGDHTALVTPSVGETVTIPLYAFMFVKGATDNTNDLLFACTVKLCDADTAANCDLPSCSGTHIPATISGKRRRRAADDSVVTIGQALVVRFGNTTLEEETTESAGGSDSQGAADTDKCLKNPDLQTLIAVLGFSLLLLFVAVCVLVFVLCRRRSRDRQHDKFVDDGVSMGSSRQTLQLPRPRV